MTPKTHEDFELETGLADDFDGTITEAYFEVNPEYAEIAGVQDPMLTLSLDCPDFEQSVEARYSCGAAKQWQIGRGGQEITSAKSPDSHRFNMNSRAGTIVTRMFELIGGGDKAKGQEFFLKRDHYMTEGEFYTGFGFHWKREKMSTVGGETRDVLMPNRYLGEVSAGKKAAKAVAKADDEELDNIVIELVSGKTERQVKVAAMKKAELKADDAYMKDLIATPNKVLRRLEEDGKIAKGPDEVYI